MQLKSFAATVLLASMATAAPIEVRQAASTYNGGATANDVQNGVCADITFICARGTSEGGNMGSTVCPAVAKGLSGAAIQGVDYPASVEGNISLGGDGSPTMIKDIQMAKQACPKTKIVIGGYSQGAAVATKTAADSSVSGDLVAVVLFGNPLYEGGNAPTGNVPKSDILDICAPGDGVCESGTFSISAAHLSYVGDDTDKAVAFIKDRTSGAAGSTPTTGGSDPAASSPAAPAGTGSASSGLGGLLGGLGGSSGSSGLGGLGGLTGGSSGSSGLGSLGGLTGGSSGSSGLGSLGGLTGGSSGSSGLGSLGGLTGGSSSGSSGLGSLGGLTGGSSSGSSGLGSLGSLGGLTGGSSSGSSGLGSLLGGSSA